MKPLRSLFAIAVCAMLATACDQNTATNAGSPDAATPAAPGAGQSGVQDDVSQKTVVGVAIASKDHSTLVKAIQQAELADALSNAGPFTVFAPTNTAFEQLPAGTLDDLMKNENKDRLTDILQYHVSVGVYREDMLQDGQQLGEVNGGNISITRKGEDILVNGKAKILASGPAANGLVYVIDQVLLPGK